MKTAHLYVRVSTDEQAEKGYSQRNQEEVLRKYCQIKSISIDKVYHEDHSAKTFNRPVWKKLLLDIKKSTDKADLILFTKWDRFSRNAGDSYHMINLLKRLGIEPQAIEQPLDLEVPENKMMLAFYLAAPEVENERRGLNIFHGLRRARKEGRWVSAAPLGYQNLTKSGKKYIDLIEPTATIIRESFEELAKGNYNVSQVWEMARTKGLKTTRNNFYELVRNPVYCGKVKVHKYKDEEAYLADGQHSPLVSETIFNRVQHLLDGNKKAYSLTKPDSSNELILRGFVKCTKCTRMLTGSASKGRKEYYHYYHCSSTCGVRFKAEYANEWVAEEIKRYIPKYGPPELYLELLLNAFHKHSSPEQDERKRVIGEINAVNHKLAKARNMVLEGVFDTSDFKTLKIESEKKISLLESKLPEISQSIGSLRSDLRKAISNLNHIDIQSDNIKNKQKRDIIGSMFPEYLCFDQHIHRTARTNELAENISLINSILKHKKKAD